MANKEKLAILQKGADAWNRWRAENPQNLEDSEEEIDLTHIREADIKRVNLEEVNLNCANLKYADWTAPLIVDS
ncbi:MAG: hypothetical protein PHS80_12625 [Methanothrix sp.]|nr:hypothetical protein [Methanothrix sp.]